MSSRIKFLEKFSVTSFTLSEDCTSGPWNRGDTSDLPLLRTLLAFRQKSQGPSFGEVMDSFVSLCKFDRFKNPFAKITSLSKIYFRFRRFVVCANEKSDFYDLKVKHQH